MLADRKANNFSIQYNNKKSYFNIIALFQDTFWSTYEVLALPSTTIFSTIIHTIIPYQHTLPTSTTIPSLKWRRHKSFLYKNESLFNKSYTVVKYFMKQMVKKLLGKSRYETSSVIWPRTPILKKKLISMN